MSAVWIVGACGVVLAGAGAWAAWPSTETRPARPARPGRGDDSEQGNAQQSFPVTGAHWLDGWVVFGNTYV
jgi:hypothetical protein